MPQQDTLNAIEQIKKTLENFMVSIGILCGMILVVYFFTYGMLVDSVTSSFIWFEVVTSVLILFVLIFLKRVCFFLTKLKLGRRAGCREVLQKIQCEDLSLDVEALAAKLDA